VSQSGDHLKAGQLGTADLTASTVANIGPGIDFYFAFGAIAVTAGVAAPLTTLAGAVAVVFLALSTPTRGDPGPGRPDRHRPVRRTVQAGQPAPYSGFPYIALAIVAAAIVIGCLTVYRHPTTGSGGGTTFSES
jgi:hypothetical protein